MKPAERPRVRFVRDIVRHGACGWHSGSILFFPSAANFFSTRKIPSASKPASFRCSSGVPCPMYRSGIPSRKTGILTPASAKHSKTAPPAPPATAFSSAVASRECVRANSKTNPASNGFTNRISAAVAPSFPVAAKTGASVVPKAKTASPFPFRRTAPFPTSQTSPPRAISAPVPPPRG